MTVLVAGASGFVGCGLLRSLREPVVVVSRRAAQPDRAEALARRTGATVEMITGDVRQPGWGLDPADVDRLRGDVRAVVNAAAQSSWSAGWHDLMATNVEGARHACDVAARLDVPLLHLSSLYAAYATGRHVPQALVDEAPQLTKYERSKCRGEHAVTDAAAERAVPTWIARIGALGGDLDRLRGDRAALPPMARLLDRDGWGWMPYARGARLDMAPRDVVTRCLAELLDEPPPDGVVVRNVGQGHAAPLAGAVLREAARQGLGDERPLRPVPAPASALLALSELADRFGRGPRTNLLIGARYFASSTVYLSDGLGQDVSLEALARTLVRRPRLEPRALPDFYTRWL